MDIFEKMKQEPVVTKSVIAALVGGVVSLVGLQAAPEAVGEFAEALTVVVMGVSALIASFLSRNEVMPVERVEPQSDVWWPKDPRKRSALARYFFRRKREDDSADSE